jgi:hypothetical protein
MAADAILTRRTILAFVTRPVPPPIPPLPPRGIEATGQPAIGSEAAPAEAPSEIRNGTGIRVDFDRPSSGDVHSS